jgi:hypothetical protein
LIYNIRDEFDINAGLKFPSMKNTEAYLNTSIKSQYRWATFNDDGNNDYRCNVTIDTPSHTGVLGSGSQAANNVYYDVAGTKLDSNITNETLTTRANSKAYSLGDIIRTSTSPTTACTATDSSGCFLYRVITAGTSASSNPGYCTSLGCIQQDGSMQVRAVRGPYTFYRKLRTKPERYTIPYARAYASATSAAENAPEAYKCPSDYSKRLRIGIN